jgi:putative ABC transport system permease protein
VSAVWRAARAAVGRRRLQTVVIGVVVGLSTTMIVVAFGLMVASSGPFDQGYARQRGAHLMVAFDRAKVSDAQLAQAARQPGVEAVAGPFGQSTVDVAARAGGHGRPLTVVGRADPSGPVDRLSVWRGRWAANLGEIVLSQDPTAQSAPGSAKIGSTLTVAGGPTLTVVGFAHSLSATAEAWVTPDQMAALHPTATQMLYRFTHAATSADVSRGQAAVTAGLPSGVELGSRSYLTLKAAVGAEAATYVPFLMVFGLLSLLVAVLIVANVVSGAVVAGFRHIGVLKALGFTPNQVLAVYLAMVSVPATIGCVLGTVLGDVLAKPLLTNAFRRFGSVDVGVAPWVNVAVLLGVPLVVALSAFVPALRAGSLPASEAISAGSAQRNGRGLRVQRWLTGTRLPRSLSLGLGLPLARPARSALTMAAVVMGVASMTLAIGLGKSFVSYDNAENRVDAVQAILHAHHAPPGETVPPGAKAGLSDTADESILRSLPGTVHVTASTTLPLQEDVGTLLGTQVTFYRGDPSVVGYQVLQGHRLDGPGQIAVSQRFLTQRGLAVGDTITLPIGNTRTQVRIVAKVLLSTQTLILSNWQTLALIAPDTQADTYEVQLKPGTDPSAYVAAAEAADPTLQDEPVDGADSFLVLILTTISVLTLMLGSLAALGVFNTVVLNTRERRRDLGVLKSIGMTPRQVTAMVVTSMAALGALGGVLGIPFGIGAHRVVIPAVARAAQVAFPDFMLRVFPAPMLVLLALAGVGIAAFGAFLPARSAARATIAEALRNE